MDFKPLVCVYVCDVNLTALAFTFDTKAMQHINDSSTKKESDNTKSEVEIEHGPESTQHLSLHSRCQVKPGSRRGEIAFLGEVAELVTA